MSEHLPFPEVGEWASYNASAKHIPDPIRSASPSAAASASREYRGPKASRPQLCRPNTNFDKQALNFPQTTPAGLFPLLITCCCHTGPIQRDRYRIKKL